MKHTDFYKLIEEIKLQEQCELKAAIKSVGGCYIWDIYDGEAEYPIIAVNMDSISLVSVSAMLPLFFKQEYLALSSKKDESRNSFSPYSRSLQGTFA